MKKLLPLLTICAILSCNDHPAGNAGTAVPGTFGYDLNFLSQRDSIIVLRSGESEVIVSHKYQAKVFTSTANGDTGTSFGWINYKAFDAPLDPHMNAYGGENRIWVGPEGGKFSFFFPAGSHMDLSTWKTPAAFDSEPWTVKAHTAKAVDCWKAMLLTNYAGNPFNLVVDRQIVILDRAAIDSALALPSDTTVRAVGYKTINTMTNTGSEPWTTITGAPNIWLLDMQKTSPATTIVIPYTTMDGTNPATTDYFGEIPAERIKCTDGIVYFKADGKIRSKLGVHSHQVKPVLGSYDAENKLLTINLYDVDTAAEYLDQEWRTTGSPFVGDAVHTYNDGPLPNGTQMGPFYELESASPALFLAPGQSHTHHHTVFHFTGSEAGLNAIAQKVLGVSLDEISHALP
jgi:hypothetical protein